jgi:histidyl-tRNA synthetase
MKFQRPPGTHDVYPGATAYEDNSALWQLVESQFRDVCRRFSYEEIRTPLFEATELFKRAVGVETDIVSKEMYTFEDRGGRSMTLRPEGTAPVLRAYIENALYARGGATKLFYIGPNFRYERAQKGRYRQHTQVGLEALGSQDPRLDAEIIHLATSVLKAIGIKKHYLSINSVGCPVCRPSYRDALIAFATPLADQMSEENRRRLHENPLRMLDSKDPRDQELLASAPILTDYLCGECADHYAALKRYLAVIRLEFIEDSRLVRGFDYYTKTAFEITSPDLGAHSALCGGGRYDGLVEELGGPATPGIGFGMGVERVLIALQALEAEAKPGREPWVFVVALGQEATHLAVGILSELREGGLRADTDFAGKSLKSQLREANRSGARYALLLGDDEIAAGKVVLKDLLENTQEDVPLNSYIEALKGKIEGA